MGVMDQSGSASDPPKSQITVQMKVNSAARTFKLRFLLQKLVSLHLIGCLTLIHSCFRNPVGSCVCADMKVHSRSTNTFSCRLNQDKKYDNWNLYVRF